MTKSIKAAKRNVTVNSKPAAAKAAPVQTSATEAAAPAKPVTKRLANNATENAQFSHVLKLTPNAGSGKLAASAPFHPLTVEQAKAGKITNKTSRVETYLAFYTVLADKAGILPSYGDKSVMATLIAAGDVTVTDDNRFKLVNKSNKKAGDNLSFNNDFTAVILPNSNVA